MAPLNAANCCFRSEQNSHCIQQVSNVPGYFAKDFKDKAPALLAPKSRGPPFEQFHCRRDLLRAESLSDISRTNGRGRQHPEWTTLRIQPPKIFGPPLYLGGGQLDAFG
jgi:hypothetical protein